MSIPSFKWYQASPLDTGRMTMDCATYGSQIFGVGGRLAWYVDSRAGCYNMPAFIYDAESQAIRTKFDVSGVSYMGNLPRELTRTVANKNNILRPFTNLR